MSEGVNGGRAERVYRIDRFVLPTSARAEFLERIQRTHGILRTQPGFVRDMVAEQLLERGGVEVVTFAEWDSIQRIAPAKAAVEAVHREAKFDPKEMFERLGISAEIGLYRPIYG